MRKRRLSLTTKKNVAEVKEAYAEGSADYIKYMARVEEDYTKAKNAGLLSITEKYFSEEQKIHDDHKKAIAAIEKEFVEGDPNRTLFVDLQNASIQRRFRITLDLHRKQKPVSKTSFISLLLIA